MNLLLNLSKRLDSISEYTGRAVSWLAAVLVFLICVSVTMRYVFNESKIYLDELHWHLFSLLFLLGAAYALKHDRHVRVDVIYQRFSPKGQALINLLGTLLFLLPFCLLVVRQAWVFTERAFLNNESSADPGGLPYRFFDQRSHGRGVCFTSDTRSIYDITIAFNLTGAYKTPYFRQQDGLICKLYSIDPTLTAMPESTPILLFGTVFLLLLAGYPVAFTLGGVAVIFGVATLGVDFFYALPLRIYGNTMNNPILMAVPLFIFMGIMLEKSGLAERLLETMALLFGKFRGGLAIAVIIVGALLAASTGIVGATVITMGLISLPTMLKRGYSPELATGTIASSGTLGQIIPPSVVLVLLGSVLNVSVGDLFKAAFLPGILLVAGYLLYILLLAWFRPEKAPSMPPEEVAAFREGNVTKQVLQAFVLPFLLILAVLGSIFAGIASPTEAAAVGAMGATLLTLIQGKFDLDILKQVVRETTHLTAMVFMILIGATAFSLVFKATGGDHYLRDLILGQNLSPQVFLLLVMLIVFVAGFFIDFIEIIFIIVPIVAPIFGLFEPPFNNLIWIGILLAINLQSSFLTPPFGFALFYLKGVAPPNVKTQHLYKGIIPFLAIQISFLLLIIFFPEVVTFVL